MDDTTLITQTAAPLPKVSERREVFARRVQLSPVQKLTRAHLAASARPLAMESMDAAVARVAQTRGTSLKTSLSCRASLTPSTLHPLSHVAAKALFVTLDLGGDALGLVEIDNLCVGALLASITGANESVGLPTRLSNIEEAALAWVVLTTLSELRKEAVFENVAPRLVSMSLDRSDALASLDARRRHVSVQLSLQLGNTTSLVRVIVPALWAQSKLELLATENAPAPQKSVLDATLATTCLIGSALLPPREASNLTVGDVLVFAGISHGAQGLKGHGRLVTPTFELQGTFTEAGFTLTRALERSTQEYAMSNVDPSMPVEIEVELTRVRLPVHQLGQIRPGGLIPLHINAAQQVVVRIGDKAVARAELVEIEGEIGARIVTML
jgi:type III secretion protein Q